MVLSIERLVGQRQIEEVLPLRQLINVPGRDATFAEREQQKDSRAFVFAFRNDRKLIGTLRCIPFGTGVAPLEHVARENVPALSAMLQNCCEMGRLVLDTEHRGELLVLAECFYLTCWYLEQYTPIRNGFTMGTRALTRLYQRLGCTLVAKDVRLNDQQQPLSLLHGSTATIKLQHAKR